MLKEKMKEYNKKDAKFYGNMFAKLTALDSKVCLRFTSSGFTCLFGVFLSFYVVNFDFFCVQKTAPKVEESMPIDSKA